MFRSTLTEKKKKKKHSNNSLGSLSFVQNMALLPTKETLNDSSRRDQRTHPW